MGKHAVFFYVATVTYTGREVSINLLPQLSSVTAKCRVHPANITFQVLKRHAKLNASGFTASSRTYSTLKLEKCETFEQIYFSLHGLVSQFDNA